jgi:DNA (cytosine-5)-methyltransferase 1
MNYYNEIDKDAAKWLRNLIAAGHIPDGYVDDRSIEDVKPNELTGYTQCHFFAGIGGWALALRLAGWPDSRSVWTGSCPCQPFSAAGRGDGFADQRHLWPAWFHLIKECRPWCFFGEQVAAAVGHKWLDLVQSDMEGQGYRVGATVLGAHSVGAPHIRQRLWFVGDSDDKGSQGHGRLVHVDDSTGRQDAGRHSSTSGFWPGELRTGSDGKARLIESGIEPLAHGIPARVVRLRAYGNAIVPQVAAALIRAYSSIAGIDEVSNAA